MNLLALDTATEMATVAVTKNDRLISERGRRVTTHSEGLMSMIDEALREARLDIADLDAIICGSGPGSFTGLRIGMATAKGLCFAAGKPLCCVPSMVGVAGAVAEKMGCQQETVVLLDARRNELFCGRYRGFAQLVPDSVLSPEAARLYAQQHAEAVVAGDGVQRFKDNILGQLRLAPRGCHGVHARFLAQAGRVRVADRDFDDLASAVPQYIRDPDIRKPKPSAKAGRQTN